MVWPFWLILLPLLYACIWAAMLVVATLLRFEFNTNRSLTGGVVAAVAIAVGAQLSIGYATVFESPLEGGEL